MRVGWDVDMAGLDQAAGSARDDHVARVERRRGEPILPLAGGACEPVLHGAPIAGQPAGWSSRKYDPTARM